MPLARALSWLEIQTKQSTPPSGECLHQSDIVFLFPTGSLGQLITTPANPPQNSAANSNNSPQSIINKLNLSPAKTKNDLSNADKDLAALRSSLAAKKAGLSPSRMSIHSGYEGYKNLKCINMGVRLFIKS